MGGAAKIFGIIGVGMLCLAGLLWMVTGHYDRAAADFSLVAVLLLLQGRP